MKIRTEITGYIEKALHNLNIEAELSAGKYIFNLEHPDEISHGDYATNVALVYAKKLGVKPFELAGKITAEIQKQIETSPQTSIEKIDMAGPGFINFHLKPSFFAKSIEVMLEPGPAFGSSAIGTGKKVVVEYSSPNIAKPFTVGHLRSTVIGDAIAKILVFSGYDVIRDNHIGDWGTQFGKLLVAIERYAGKENNVSESEAAVEEKFTMRDLVSWYVHFHEDAEKDPQLEHEARAKFAALEKGDAQAKKMYEKMYTISTRYFTSVYNRLGIEPFDAAHHATQQGESFYLDLIPSVMKNLRESGLLTESEGAELVFFKDANDKDIIPPLMIEKKDGATLYASRDLATDTWRKKEYGADVTIINEVGGEQSLYFRQLFEVEQKIGLFKKEQRVHVAHGLYRFKDGKMSTRKGNVIWLEDILDEAEKRASEFNPVSDVAKKVSVGAIKFNDLKRESAQDIVFDWDEVLNIKGDSSPYLQYSCARALSIVMKAKEAGIQSGIESVVAVRDSHVPNKLEKLLYRFPEVVERAAREYQPHFIPTYLLEVAAAFNSFYGSTQIVNKENPHASYYVALTEAFAIVIKSGLNLLGIEVPEKM